MNDIIDDSSLCVFTFSLFLGSLGTPYCGFFLILFISATCLSFVYNEDNNTGANYDYQTPTTGENGYELDIDN